MGRRSRSTGLSAVKTSHKKHNMWCWKHDTVDTAIIFFVFILNSIATRAAIKVPNVGKIFFFTQIY